MTADLVGSLHLRMAALVPGWPRCRLVLALSGGIDSVVLLHALVQLRRRPELRRRLQLRAVHVDHHLQARSSEWRAHCETLARRWRVSLTLREARIPRRRGESLEALARDARYALLAEELTAGECLLVAQHQDDQLETVLLQLLRGAGPAGLAAMPESADFGAGRMLRPLLGVDRRAIERYAEANKLRWIEDPSNADPRFDRNFLRLRVLPTLRERWPAAAATVSRSARHMAEAQQLIEMLAQQDLAAIALGNAVQLSALRRLPAARQRAVIRFWLQQRGCSMPDAVHLARIVDELPAARGDANPVVRWAGGEVRRYDGALFCTSAVLAPPRAGEWLWRRHREFILGEGWGRLRVVRGPQGAWRQAELPSRLQVGYRAGGEKFGIAGQRQSLKELLRSARVLPWLRAQVPVVSGDGQIWCVPGLWQRESAFLRNSVPGAAPGRGRADSARIGIEWIDAPQLRLPTSCP